MSLNVIATLEHWDLVRKIWILLTFTIGEIGPNDAGAISGTDTSTSLGGWHYQYAGASRYVLGLQALFLSGIPFPGLPRFLLSASDLSYISLDRIPHTGHISPKATVAGLSALTRLRSLIIQFESPASRPDKRGRRPPPLTRLIPPALFDLEALVARIDAPRLHTPHLLQSAHLGIQQLPYFIGHAGILRSSSQAKVIFANNHVEINLYLPKRTDPPKKLNLRIYCRAVDWQVWSMA
ncbi:hypothetical protein BJV78DRAFT_944579 [Lactifluus subvellereus]|nr:hypothetical protein BJV78DRAFT_944579 [Lactifluus subvellereus]